MAGFKIATGYVEVEVLYDQNRLNKAATAAGKNAGSGFSTSFLKQNKSSEKLINKQMEKLGESSSKSFSTTFSKTLTKRLMDTYKNLDKGSENVTKQMGLLGKNAAHRFGTEFSSALNPKLATAFKNVQKSSKSVAKEIGLFGAAAADRFGEQFKKNLTPHIDRAFDTLRTRSRWVSDTFKDLGDKAGLNFSSRLGFYVSNSLPRIRDTFRRNFNPIVADVENIGSEAGSGFGNSFNRVLGSRLRVVKDGVKKTFDRVSTEISDTAPIAARLYANRFKEVFSQRLPSALHAFERGVDSVRVYGERSGRGFINGIRSSISGQKGLFGHIKVQAERDSNLLGTIGKNGGRLFTNGLGQVLESGGRASWMAFRAASKASVHLTMVGLVAIIAAVIVAMPAIGAGIAGALTLGFAGGIGALGVLAWKESEKVKTAFSEMSDFIKEDFKRISAPMESVLVDLAAKIRETYTALSPALESFFTTTEPAFKSFQDNILEGFESWGPAIEGSGSAFAALERSMGPMMRSKIAELGKAFEELFAAVEKNPEAVTAVFRGIMNAIIGIVKVITWLTETWAAMRDAWNRDAGGMRSIIQGVGSALEGVIGGVIAVGRGMLTALWEMISGIVTGIQKIFSGDFLGGIHRIFEGVFRGIGRIASGMVEGITHLVAKLFQIFGVDTSKWVSNTMSFLYTTWNTVLDFFQGLPATIGGWFSNLWDGIKNTFNGFISWVQGFGSTIIHWITWPFREVYRIIVGNSIIPDLVRAVLGWIQNMLTWIMVPLNAIKNFFVAVFTAIFNTVSNIVRNLVNTVVNVFSGLGSGVRGVLSGLGNFFSSIWNGIRNTVVGIVTGMVNWVKSTFNSWVGWIYDKFNALRTNGANIWNGLGNAIRSAVSAVVNWVRTTFSNWVGWIYDKFNALRTNGANIWNSLTSAIRNIVSAVVNWVRTTFNNWVGWIYDKFNALRTNSANIWNSFTRAIRSIVSAVVNWVRNTFNNWVGWIYDKFNAMRSNSINIWNSFTRALRSVVSAVVNWVRNTFNNWVGWIYDKFNAMRSNSINIWNSFTRAIRNIVNAVVRWVQNTFNNWVGWIYDKFNAMRTNASNIWNSFTRAIRNIVSNLVRWVRNTFTSWVGWIYDKFNALKTNATNIWNSIKNNIINKITDFKNRGMRVINDFKDGVIRAFENAKRGVQRAWDAVRKAASAPVKFMVNTVYEKGIRILWSKIADHVPGLGYLKKINLPRGFAKGGIMPGYTPGKDVHAVPGPSGPVGLSGGEAIMRPEWTRAVGPDFVHNMNAVARQKGVTGVRNALTPDLKTPTQVRKQVKGATATSEPSRRFANGGVVDGYLLGGIIDKAKSTVLNLGSALKSKWNDIEGNIVGWSQKPFNALRNRMKDVGGDKKNLPGVPSHMLDQILKNMKNLFRVKDDEFNMAGGDGTAQDVVKLARDSVGKYNESGGNNTNAITKWFGMNGAPWCAMFISWLFNKTNASPALKKAQKTAWTGDYYTSGMKRVAEGSRMPGDVAVYGTEHVNLVENKKNRIGGNEGHGVRRSGRRGGTIFRPDWSAAGGSGGGSGNTVLTSFWDAHAPTASGKRMSNDTIASSVIPLGSKLRVKVGGKSASGTVDDLGPASFVYKRHHPKSLLDLAEPMMQKLTGRRSNVVNGSFQVTKRGSGRTLFGYTNWSGKYSPGKSTKGFAKGGIMNVGGTPMGQGSHDVGGMLPDQHVAYNRSGEAEMVTTLDQLKAIVAAQQHAGDTIIIEKICIDAKNVKEFNDIVKMVKGLRQSARSNGGNVRFEIRD